MPLLNGRRDTIIEYLKGYKKSYPICSSRKTLREPTLSVICEPCRWGTFWTLCDSIIISKPVNLKTCPLCNNDTISVILDWDECNTHYIMNTHNSIYLEFKDNYREQVQTGIKFMDAILEMIQPNDIEQFVVE